jgi:hypothetical protein
MRPSGTEDRATRLGLQPENAPRTRDDDAFTVRLIKWPVASLERESLHTTRTGHCRRRQRSAPLGTLRYPPGTRPPAWFFGRPAASVLWVNIDGRWLLPVAPRASQRRRRSRPAIHRHDVHQPRPRVTTGRRGHGLVGLGGPGLLFALLVADDVVVVGPGRLAESVEHHGAPRATRSLLPTSRCSMAATRGFASRRASGVIHDPQRLLRAVTSPPLVTSAV